MLIIDHFDSYKAFRFIDIEHCRVNLNFPTLCLFSISGREALSNTGVLCSFINDEIDVFVQIGLYIRNHYRYTDQQTTDDRTPCLIFPLRIYFIILTMNGRIETMRKAAVFALCRCRTCCYTK